MKHLPLLAALLALFACKDDPVPPPAAPEEPAEAKVVEPPPAQPVPHPELAEVAAPAVKVTDELVLKYLAYRKAVVEQGREVVKELVAAQAKEKAEGSKKAGSLRAQEATEQFGARMRELEERAREAAKLSREEVVAVGQVTGEVLAARQIWQRSGGDAAVEQARAQLAALGGEERAKAEAALAQRAKGFATMREARSARSRFGDAAVDAVLAHEAALFEVQREGARVMAAIY